MYISKYVFLLTSLVVAAIVISTKNGEYDEARRAIHELGFPPDCEDQDGSTPLIAACSNNDPGSIEMVQYLLSVGANVNATNRTVSRCNVVLTYVCVLIFVVGCSTIGRHLLQQHMQRTKMPSSCC